MEGRAALIQERLRGLNDSSTYTDGEKGELREVVQEKPKKFDHRLDVLNKKVSQVIKDWEDNDTVEHKTTFFPVPHQTMDKESL